MRSIQLIISSPRTILTAQTLILFLRDMISCYVRRSWIITRANLCGNAEKFFQRCVYLRIPSGSSSPGRATASQAVGSGFESRLPLKKNGDPCWMINDCHQLLLPSCSLVVNCCEEEQKATPTECDNEFEAIRGHHVIWRVPNSCR